MNELLSKILDAHGGLARRNTFELVSAAVVTKGTFWRLKGLPFDQDPCHVTVWLHREHSILSPDGQSELYYDYTSSRIAILRRNGSMIAVRENPRDSFVGHIKPTWWDPLQLAYFKGYALWSYMNTPFLLSAPDVEVTEIEPWFEDGVTLRVLRGRFPDTASTHSTVQDFFFAEDLLLRRHDHRLDIAGGFAVTQLLHNYAQVDGMHLPTLCEAFMCGSNRQVIIAPPMVSVDIGDVQFS